MKGQYTEFKIDKTHCWQPTMHKKGIICAKIQIENITYATNVCTQMSTLLYSLCLGFAGEEKTIQNKHMLQTDLLIIFNWLIQSFFFFIFTVLAITK